MGPLKPSFRSEEWEKDQRGEYPWFSADSELGFLGDFVE